MSAADLLDLSIAELAPLLRDRKASPVEVTQAALDRIAKVDGRLNSFITVTADQAMAAARRTEAEIAAGRWRGALHGVPIGLKDLFNSAGVVTTMTSARGISLATPICTSPVPGGMSTRR